MKQPATGTTGAATVDETDVDCITPLTTAFGEGPTRAPSGIRVSVG